MRSIAVVACVIGLDACSKSVEVQTTFLGAHAIPSELRHDRAAYLAQVCEAQLPAVAAEGLADAVDVFCEGIGFSLAESRRLFERARALFFFWIFLAK